VGDAALAKSASDKLLSEHNIYVQSINYPTVAVGEERLRITVTPRHTLEQMDKLVRAVDKIFTELQINRLNDWKAAGGRAGVGLPNASDEVEPMWTDKQLGLLDGTAPRMLRTGDEPVVDPKAASVARSRFNTLLGKVEEERPSRAMNAGLGALKMKTGMGKRIPSPEEMEIPAVPHAITASA